MGKYPERITKTRTFIGKYNWEEINYTSEKDDQKKLEKYKSMFQDITQIAIKKKYHFIDQKPRRIALSCKKKYQH